MIWAISPNNYDAANPPGAGYEPVYWIWSEANYPNEEYQIGWCFFRNSFTLASDTVITFAVTADNYFTFFVEPRVPFELPAMKNAVKHAYLLANGTALPLVEKDGRSSFTLPRPILDPMGTVVVVEIEGEAALR